MLDNDFYKLYYDTVKSTIATMHGLREKDTSWRQQHYLDGVVAGMESAIQQFTLLFSLYDKAR